MARLEELFRPPPQLLSLTQLIGVLERAAITSFHWKNTGYEDTTIERLVAFWRIGVMMRDAPITWQRLRVPIPGEKTSAEA